MTDVGRQLGVSEATFYEQRPRRALGHPTPRAYARRRHPTADADAA